MQVQQLKVVGIEAKDGGDMVAVKLEGRRPSVPGFTNYRWMAYIYLTPDEAATLTFGQVFELRMASADDTRMLSDQEIERMRGRAI